MRPKEIEWTGLGNAPTQPDEQVPRFPTKSGANLANRGHGMQCRSCTRAARPRSNFKFKLPFVSPDRSERLKLAAQILRNLALYLYDTGWSRNLGV